ncbi:hypothetical protein CDAR_529181 [Caerostris darwini]|uniref:Uncharacterized protein n=1 Tax=Caerostris darwini TaxID=1538125 RepID=A0AAV4TW69_9ARAC|nr:hypothetical protein CDAR_529181 [Caerostris darwini]
MHAIKCNPHCIIEDQTAIECVGVTQKSYLPHPNWSAGCKSIFRHKENTHVHKGKIPHHSSNLFFSSIKSEAGQFNPKKKPRENDVLGAVSNRFK